MPTAFLLWRRSRGKEKVGNGKQESQLQVEAEDIGVWLEEIKARYADGIPAGRIGRPEKV